MVDVQNRSSSEHSGVIKEIAGNRLDKYNIVSELKFLIDNGYASSIDEVWKIDDSYVTLLMCEDIESNDVQVKISKRISQLK